jgi:putative phosphoribosyl transferase
MGLVRKIGVPCQPELAMGAVADGGEPTVIPNEDVIGTRGISAAQFMVVCDRELFELERRRRRYLGRRPPVELTDKTAIVIDDGIATGATTRAALRSVRIRKPRKLVLAVPVAPTDALEELRNEADEIVCLEAHELLGAIGVFYSAFHQISDEDVGAILNRFSSHAD